VSDHFGVYSHIANPEVENEELRKVTVTEAYWRRTSAYRVEERIQRQGPSRIGLLHPDSGIHSSLQISNARIRTVRGKPLVLAAPGHPEIQATSGGITISYRDRDGRRYQLFGVRIDPEYRKFLASGAEYSLRPINTSGIYAWTVKDSLVLKVGPPQP
jgi:hypothetical protein